MNLRHILIAALLVISAPAFAAEISVDYLSLIHI